MDAIPDEQRRAVDALLSEVRSRHAVAIPLAVESGSRAWGFPSPDSDFDCRFIFVRRPDDYLSPWSQRDVIEPEPLGLLDASGWELGKALKLMLNGNAVVVEWLTSPIDYLVDTWFRAELLALAGRWSRRSRIARHYLHLGARQRRIHFDGCADADAPLKRLFYVVRPAAALRWLRGHPGSAIVPMHFPTLLAEAETPGDVRRIMGELIAMKAVTRELGRAPVPRTLLDFVDAEFAAAETAFPLEASFPEGDAREDAEHVFRNAVRRLHPCMS